MTWLSEDLRLNLCFIGFALKEGYLVTFSEEDIIREQGVTINVMPAYKFFVDEILTGEGIKGIMD